MMTSIVHPGSHSAAAETCSKLESGGTHGEVAYQVPHQTDELDYGRDESQ